MVQRKVTYRLYPRAEQRAALDRMRWIHCLLWNQALHERRYTWGAEQRSLGFSDQCRILTQWRAHSPLLRSINAQSEQVTLKRLDLAFKHFYRRVKNGEKPGFPRFKPLHRFAGWGYKTHGDGWRLITNKQMKHGTLRLAGIGKIPVRGKPRTPGMPKTCEVLYRNGKWYASVTLDCTPERTGGTGLAGLDWGLETFATLAEVGETSRTIANPRWLKRSAEKIRQAQRSVSRKEHAAQRASGRQRGFPVSNRLRKAYARVRALHARVARQRDHFTHQVTAQLVERYGAIAVEELNIKGMSAHGGSRKKGLNRGILDAAGGVFHQRLRYKAEEAGIWVMEAPTRTLAPSQTCHACGRREKKPLGQRWHACPCGASCSRDENAGRVLLHWLEHQLQRAGTVPCVEGGKTGECTHPPARPAKRETSPIPDPVGGW